MKRLERKIGETFEYHRRKLKVMKGVDGCTGCYFKEYSCRNNNIIGECIYCRRNDHTGVIFVDITDEPEENLQAEQPEKQEAQETKEHKEREIGEVFEYEGKALRVEEYKDNVNKCFGCFFDGKCFLSKAVGPCAAERRTDKKNVIFVEVKEEPEENLQAEQPQQEVQQETEEPKEREIGDIFEYEGKKLKVVEPTKNLCFDCYFWDGVNCQKTSRECGECDEVKRTDYKPVIFVEVKDEQPQEEKPQELNLCEVLKYCPQGETFWSPMLGDVKLHDIDQETKKINVILASGATWDINADGTITIDNVTSPEVMLYPSSEQMAWTKVKYEKKKELPRSWEEFCRNYPCKKDECFITTSCGLYLARERDERHVTCDRNLLPSKEAAEAHLAYMQLHQLRDAWREGWLPDWTDEDQTKYVILNTAGEFTIRGFYTMSCFLAFQDEKRAKDFFACFIDLIRKAGDLI